MTEAPAYLRREVDSVHDALLSTTKRIMRTMHTKLITDYSFLIGDDTSGRLPTLLFRNSINQIRQELHPHQATIPKLPIPVYFLRAGRNIDYLTMQEQFRKTTPHLLSTQRAVEKPKGLVITDCVATESSLRKIDVALTAPAVAMPYDVITYQLSALDREIPANITVYKSDASLSERLHAKKHLTGLSRDLDNEQEEDRSRVIHDGTTRAVVLYTRKKLLEGGTDLARFYIDHIYRPSRRNGY